MAKKRKKRKSKKVRKVSKKKASPKKRKGKKKSTHKKVKKVSKKRASPKKRKAKKKSHKKVSRKVSRRRARKAAASRRHDKKFVKVHSKAMRTIERIKKGRFKKVKIHGKKYTILRNPLGGAMKKKIEQALGHSTMEAVGLAAGGVILTAVPQLVSKVVPSQYSATVKKYHIDSILLPLLLGAAINLKAKSSKVQAIGKGIVGAAVVKASMTATQYAESKLLPSAVSPMQGFVPGPAMGTARLLRKGKGDFGNVSVMKKSKADFGGYTPPPVDFAGDFLDSDMSSDDEENAQMG